MTDTYIEEPVRARLVGQFAFALAESGIDRDARVWDLTDAETIALLTPLLNKARAAGAAEMQERCAGVADSYSYCSTIADRIAAAIRSLT